MTEENIRTQMRKGILEFCVLLLLQQGRAYPSDIITRLKTANLLVVEGTLYAMLNRLRKEGKLSYEWVESTQGPPRKYYSLTPVGEQTIAIMRHEWTAITMTVAHFL